MKATSDCSGLAASVPGARLAHGGNVIRMSAGDSTRPGQSAWAKTAKGRSASATTATKSGWLRAKAATRARTSLRYRAMATNREVVDRRRASGPRERVVQPRRNLKKIVVAHGLPSGHSA